MSQTLILPAGARAGFEAAARAYEHARGRTPASRQIEGQPLVAAQSVEGAIAKAAQQTSIDFDFLIAQAQVESAMNPDAEARTSSATGLYQFIESTWLDTMKRHGERFGLGDVAAQIGMTRSGSAYVADPAQREAILAMRNDPEVSSLMAAGLAEDNRAHLFPILGRQPDHSELYLAHFLGAGGAGRFLSELQQNPDQSAPALFRRPASANRAIFYEQSGSPRSLAGVMDVLSAKMQRALANAPTTGQDYRAASLAPPGFTPPPYVIADEAVFGPTNPPAITGASRPTLAPQATLSLPSIAAVSGPAGSSRPPMSNLLQATFAGQSFGSEEGSAQIRRAYAQLKALGL